MRKVKIEWVNDKKPASVFTLKRNDPLKEYYGFDDYDIFFIRTTDNKSLMIPKSRIEMITVWDTEEN